MGHNKTALTVLLFGSLVLSAPTLPSVWSWTGPGLADSAIQKSKEKGKNKEKDEDKKQKDKDRDDDEKQKDKDKSKDKEKGGGADSERETGRRALRRGEAGDALVHLENAQRLYKQAGDKSGEAATHDLLGQLFDQQARYGLALERFVSALKIYVEPKKGSAYNANLMLAKIGNMLYRQGDLAQARTAYEKMSVKKPGSKAKGLAGILGGIAVGAASDDNSVQIGAPAVGGALSAKDIFDRYRRTILYAGHEIGLGRIDYRAGDLEGAKEHFDDALSATKSNLPGIGNLGQTRRFRVAARTNLGDVALKQGNFKDAVDNYDDAAKEAKKEKRLDLMWPAQRGLGRSLWLQAAAEKEEKKKEKLRAEALAAYAAAIESIEDLRAGSLRADEARTTFLATTRDVFEEASSALAEMALMSARPGAARGLDGQSLDYATRAFEVVERGRARSLLDLLGETGTNIREGVPPELFKLKQENLDQQSKIAELLSGVITDKASKSVESLEKDALELQDEEISIENKIRTASPRYKQLTSPQPLSLSQVQQQVLDEGTALLEYSLGDQVSYLWAVTRDAAWLFRLPARASIDAQVDELRRLIVPPDAARSILELTAEERQRGLIVRKQDTTGSASVFANASHKLYKSIIEPAGAVIRGRRLLIVPDGALSFVPFETLVSAPGADYASLPYLARTNETVYAPSASVVDAVRRQASGNAPIASAPILLIADPIFSPGDERAKNLPTGSASAVAARGLFVTSAVSDVASADKPVPASFVIRRLPGTREEADQIEQTARTAGLRAEKWLDLEASEANANGRDLKPYRVLHIATHGLLDAAHPQFSGLVLSLVGNKEGKDGFLRTDEIFNLRLGSPLVMLSACQTGLGKERRGEGVMGLTRAFMYAGAPLVGVTLWSVDDKPTADLMTDFYRNLLAAGGGKPVSALRAARQNMIADRKYSAPFYWAPFVLIGDWR
jgi:CHAT domain-containing protein